MIVIKDINKSYGDKQALNNVSFHITAGERVGIIGLNGAGKTTLLNIISGISRPDDGFIRVNNVENILENYEAKKDIVYISGTRLSLWEDLKIMASYENCISMYSVDKATAKKRLNELIEIFELGGLLDSLPRTLSLGERMRCELVYAFLIRPKLILLDEAMIGLDVSVKHKIMGCFETLKNEKCTIIYTSHNLSEVEKICDRILLLDKGRIIFDGTIEHLLAEYAPIYSMKVAFEGDIPDLEDMPVEKAIISNNTIEIQYRKQKITTKHIIAHIVSRCKIVDMKLIEPNLEDTIKKIYREV